MWACVLLFVSQQVKNYHMPANLCLNICASYVSVLDFQFSRAQHQNQSIQPGSQQRQDWLHLLHKDYIQSKDIQYTTNKLLQTYNYCNSLCYNSSVHMDNKYCHESDMDDYVFLFTAAPSMAMSQQPLFYIRKTNKSLWHCFWLGHMQGMTCGKLIIKICMVCTQYYKQAHSKILDWNIH